LSHQFRCWGVASHRLELGDEHSPNGRVWSPTERPPRDRVRTLSQEVRSGDM
jgi:hypothetical protein